MDTIVTLNLIGYGLAVGGGVALGTLFGRRVTGEVSALVHGFESRLAGLEAAVLHALPGHHSTAIEHHAAATEKLAAAIQSHADSSNRPAPAAH